jgi:seryl-tRNA synthetase
MLDIRFIREHPDLVKEGIRKKGDVDNVDEILKLDSGMRTVLQKGEALKSRRNAMGRMLPPPSRRWRVSRARSRRWMRNSAASRNR